jgi:hypothetical protein
MLVSLAVMAVALGVGLTRVNRLLDQLTMSQDQLAQVTRIEADINGLLAEATLKARSDQAPTVEAADNPGPASRLSPVGFRVVAAPAA